MRLELLRKLLNNDLKRAPDGLRASFQELSQPQKQMISDFSGSLSSAMQRQASSWNVYFYVVSPLEGVRHENIPSSVFMHWLSMCRQTAGPPKLYWTWYLKETSRLTSSLIRH